MDKFIFVHLQKTAGTTLEYILTSVYGEENVAKDKEKFYRDHFTDPKEYDPFNIIYGHFTVYKYMYLKRPMITFLRDPVERMISQYFYVRPPYYMNPKPKNIKEYIEHPRMRNIATTQLGTLDHFSFVGIQERFEESLKALEKFLGVKFPDTYENQRVNTKRKKPVNQKIRDRIKELNSKDYEMYNEGLKRLKERTGRNV